MSIKLRTWRSKLKINQAQAAKLLDCSVSQLSEVENGKANFSTKKMKDILANVSSLTPDHFLTQ